MSTASAPELAWIGLGLLVGGVNFVLWLMATDDLLACYQSGTNGAKRLEAWTWHVAHLFLLAQQAVALAIGVWAALTPPADPRQPVSTLGLVLITGLLAKQGINAALGVWLLIRRRALDRYLDREWRRGPKGDRAGRD